jgi:hypothetical protein
VSSAAGFMSQNLEWQEASGSFSGRIPKTHLFVSNGYSQAYLCNTVSLTDPSTEKLYLAAPFMNNKYEPVTYSFS